MRQIFITCVIVANFTVLSGQTRIPALYECIYKYTISGCDNKGHIFEDIGYCMLQIGKGIGKFYDYTSYQTDSVRYASNDKQIVNSYLLREQRSAFFFDQIIYQNLPKGSISVQGVITPNRFNYREERYPIQWSLKEECDTVCGYHCKIAYGEYGGRKWIVKYAPEIPAQNGPWKMTGLPGLVLEAKDNEGVHHFTAITIRNSSVPISPIDLQGSIETSREKFLKSKNKFEEDPMANIILESIGEMEVRKNGNGASGSIVFINGVQLRMRTHPYIPLEIN